MTTRRILLSAHLLAICVGAAYLLLSVTVGTTPDANIGAGLALLWLGLLGSPWSWPLVGFNGSGWLLAVAVSATALVNLALHALLWGLVVGRRRRR